MNGWKKQFIDGTIEIGSDKDVLEKRASWSNGRLDGMNCVAIEHNNIHIAIAGEGEYWQSDDFEIAFFKNGSGNIVARRIMKKLEPDERILHILETEHSTMLRIIGATTAFQILTAEKIETVPIQYTATWLVLEYDVEQNRVHWYYSEDKI